MCTAYVLVAALAIGGTVAYLQDSDSDVNVMSLGNVKIEQHEYQRAEGVAHNEGEPGAGNGVKEGALVPFVQGQALYPAVPKNNAGGDYTAEMDTANLFFWGDYVYSGTAGNGLWDDSKLSNVMDKMVFVENTGKSDAYIRTVIAFECPEGITIGEPSQGAEIMINTNIGTYDWDDVGYITVDGVRYAVMTATYKKVLAPGNQSHPSLLQVVMTHHATNEDVALLGDTYEILVVSQAVQVAGFADAETALNAGFGDITTTNHPWTNTTISSEVGITEAGTYNLDGDVYTIDSAYFHTQKVTAPVTINGNGATVEGVATSVDAFQWEGGTIPAMSAIFSSADGSKVTVNDLKFTGTMSSIMLGNYVNSTYNKFDTELNNVDVIGTEVVSFSANISPAVTVYGTAVLNNCNIYGTTLSKLDTDPMWPVYDLVAVNYTDVTINNSKIGSICMWNQAKVTVAAGTEVETIVVRGNMNTTKYGLTVEAGATVGAIDLSAITNKAKININIDNGATVGKIIANGVEYATIADWLNA
jgi:hypothetical protein